MAVPRRYLLVWMGPQFTYGCRLAIDSIAQADPYASIEVHVLGDAPRSGHFARLQLLAQVAIRTVDLDELFEPLPDGRALRSLFDAIPADAASARSNLLRYALLFERGGVYVDFDVLVRSPLPHLAGGRDFIGSERVWSCDQARVEGRWTLGMLPATVGWAAARGVERIDCKVFAGAAGLARRLERVASLWSTVQANNAVIGASPRSAFIGRVLDRALDADPTVRYALGPTLVSQVATEAPDTVAVLPEHVLYCVPPGASYRFFEDRRLVLPDDAALIHYVSSNHRSLLAGVVENDERFSRSEVFWRLAAGVERRRAFGALSVAA
jgi:Glycosyltransferase sugar-binding region containing DXD motif